MRGCFVILPKSIHLMVLFSFFCLFCGQICIFRNGFLLFHAALDMHHADWPTRCCSMYHHKRVHCMHIRQRLGLFLCEMMGESVLVYDFQWFGSWLFSLLFLTFLYCIVSLCGLKGRCRYDAVSF